MDLLFYCRSGYEADLLLELEQKLGDKGHYGYAKFTKNSGFLRFQIPQVALKISRLKDISQTLPALKNIVFARQKLIVVEDVVFTTEDRIGELLELDSLQGLPVLGDVFVEYPDTEDGKQLAKFCKKFVVPLRNKLRQKGLLHKKPSPKQAFLHLLFQHSGQCVMCISLADDRSIHPLGIQRLKMPSEAPSRSTLKLEEAISTFFTKQQASALFSSGMRAADLGACPGGWCYQLIKRKLIVEAVDHGEIADNLMQTGLIEYYPEDGFLYRPQQGNVDWLVCDMIEQPTRVSELMLSWLVSGKANACIFNLKLPMNKRHKVVLPILERLNAQLNDRFGQFLLEAKHLYHNRDEVTVAIIVNSQMLNTYNENKG
jgi:23S rRNA (cytidine2498-2'-O)-methyltransferase